ncbi:MAG: AIR synthase-related protein [Lachnospiraceae bacterium]|nr:AIR synthase-related protein [Lachnospiraceae bacterium]
MGHVLRNGKLKEDALSRSVNRIMDKYRTDNNEADPGNGVRLVLSSDPITLRTGLAGMLSVYAVVNALAAKGAEPQTLSTVILLPPGSTEEELRVIEEQIGAAAKAERIIVTGGHTEVTTAVMRPVIIASGTGIIRRSGADSDVISGADSDVISDADSDVISGADSDVVSGAAGKRSFAGWDIVMSKYAGIEGTAMLAAEMRAKLADKFSEFFVKEAGGFTSMLSVRPEAVTTQSIIPEAVMMNASEGGIYAALWKLADKCGAGITVDLKKIPVRQETIEISNYFDFDPYMMESAGSLLMAVPEGRGEELVQALADGSLGAGCNLNNNGKNGQNSGKTEFRIPAAVIGKMTAGNDKVIINGDDRRFLTAPEPDSLIKILS